MKKWEWDGYKSSFGANKLRYRTVRIKSTVQYNLSRKSKPITTNAATIKRK